jgi:hypothetical protein
MDLNLAHFPYGFHHSHRPHSFLLVAMANHFSDTIC